MSLRIALFTEPPLPEWCEQLVCEAERRGHQVEVVQQFDPQQGFEVGFVRVRPDHHPVSQPDYWTAAQAFEQSGLPLLNSIAARTLAADKMALFDSFSKAGLNTPPAWPLDSPLLPDFPLVCKPRSGSCGLDIIIAHSLEEALAHQDEVGRECLLQQIIQTRRCVRVVATPDRVISAYEKRAVPGQFVLSVSLGADRHPIHLSEEMEEMALRMVSAVGADLAGCDLLEDESGELWALEINNSFAFDPDSSDIVSCFVDQLERLAASGPH